MICNEFKINESLGVIIFNEIILGGGSLKKGHQLAEEDIVQLKKYGVNTIFGALMEAGDISFKTALGIVAAKLCGANTAYQVGTDGICRVVSTIEGVMVVNEDRVAKFNRLSPNLILNVANPYRFVKTNEVIAEVELTLPIIPQAQIDEVIFKLSGNLDMLSVHDVSSKKTGLIYSHFSDSKEETKHFTAIVKKLVKDFPLLNLDFVSEYDAEHNIEDLANTLQRVLKDPLDVVFVLGGQPNNSSEDITLSAIKSLVDDVVNVSLPQVQASDLIIADKRQKRIIVLPYNYDKVETSYLVRYITQGIVSDKLNVFDFAHHANYFLKESSLIEENLTTSMISATNASLNPKEPHIAAIVLAAGVGARSGRNKLLVDVNGRPLFLNALEAAIKSKASPVFLVTGYQADEMEEYVEDIDVNVLYNTAYRSGVRTSIDLGIKSVPGFCDGALIIPADMPYISAEYINKMIKAFKKSEPRQLIIANYHEVKHNPILWSKELYGFADIVPENADLRPIFMEHADYTKLVEVKNAEEMLDVTYPSDLEILFNK